MREALISVRGSGREKLLKWIREIHSGFPGKRIEKRPSVRGIKIGIRALKTSMKLIILARSKSVPGFIIYKNN